MKKCLIIVDMQNDFLKEGASLYLGHDPSTLIKKVYEYMLFFDGDLVVTKDWHDNDASEFLMFPKHCLKDDSGSDLIDLIDKAAKIKNAETFAKNSYYPEEISRLLEDYDEFHVVGVCTHICVHDICSYLVNSSKNKFNKIPLLYLHKSMIDDFNPSMAEFAIKRLESLYGIKVIE